MKLSEKDKNTYFKKAVEEMKVKQERLMTKFNFGEKGNKFIMYPERNRFYLYNKETNKVFFEARMQIIGTYSNKSNTWRWGWSNRYVPSELEKTALKIMEFGKMNQIEILSKPKIKDENMGYIFTALGMSLSNGKGYYIIPATRTYPDIFIMFTKVNKVDLLREDIVNQNRKSLMNTRKKYKKKLLKLNPVKKIKKTKKKKAIKKKEVGENKKNKKELKIKN